MDRLNDKWLRIFGIALLLAISISVNDYYEQPFSPRMALKAVVTLISIIVFWQVMRACIFYFRRQSRHKSHTVKRLAFTFVSGSIATTLVIWLFSTLQQWVTSGSPAIYRIGDEIASITISNRKIALSMYEFDFVQAVATFIFFQTIYEIIFFIHDSSVREKRLIQSEREKLRVANLQSQLNALKQQVNPHFLFNSLNVLDSLIEDDPRQARVFLEELSTVYRYLLRSNEHHLTELNKELDFIQSYYHLLKTRLGDGLRLNVKIDEQYQHHKIPPLTLQLLIENAFKHNIVLPDQPLIIDIITNKDGYLLVSNNVQRKNVRVSSNGVGLSNILNKYEILNQPAPMIQDDDGQFTVTLPLIEAAR